MSQKSNRGSKPSAKSGQRTPKKQTAPKLKTRTAVLFAVAGVLVVIVAVILANGTRDGEGGGVQPTAEEARYIGRLLPASYEETAVTGPADYNEVVQMTELTATATETRVSVPLADVVAAKVVLFQYTRADGSSLPLIAYIKPSGRLFVGISFCPPCQGEWQTIQDDGTLTCNSCGTKRDLETMAGISGTCKLYPLDEVPVTLSDDAIAIDRTILDSWTPQPLDREVG